MAVKTQFTDTEFNLILTDYDLGTFTGAEPISQGTVQTNYILHTSAGKFVFRYYENRSNESVSFESHLLGYLQHHKFPCAGPIPNKEGNHVGICWGKPFIILEFIDGKPIESPEVQHKEQLIKTAAELQRLTIGYQSPYVAQRWNYDAALCRELARVEAEKLKTEGAFEKLAWLEEAIADLDLPEDSPKGVCHCDFHFSNVLFKDDQLVGLIDFDDANYTYLGFDLVGLIDYWAWPHEMDGLNFSQARWIVAEYERWRPLSHIERHHLFDLHKLSILFDAIWFFGRGRSVDFFEKGKIVFLDRLGRERYTMLLTTT